MSPSQVLRVQMTVKQVAQLRDQLALGFVRKREPQGRGKIHQVPPRGADGSVSASVYQAGPAGWAR